jgi:hypothetical protein
MKTPVLLGILFGVAVVAALLYTSFGNRKFHCEVCMAYEGRTSCRKASAATRESALRSATDNACAQIASGITATMVCTGSVPVSMRWLP